MNRDAIGTGYASISARSATIIVISTSSNSLSIRCKRIATRRGFRFAAFAIRSPEGVGIRAGAGGFGGVCDLASGAGRAGRAGMRGRGLDCIGPALAARGPAALLPSSAYLGARAAYVSEARVARASRRIRRSGRAARVRPAARAGPVVHIIVRIALAIAQSRPPGKAVVVEYVGQFAHPVFPSPAA